MSDSYSEVLKTGDLNGYWVETWYEVDPSDLYFAKAVFKDPELAKIYAQQRRVQGPFEIKVLTNDGKSGLKISIRDTLLSDSEAIKRELLAKAQEKVGTVSEAQSVIKKLSESPSP